MKIYRTSIQACTITPDNSHDEGYSVKPGVEIRLPDRNVTVTAIEVRVSEGGLSFRLSTDDKYEFVCGGLPEVVEV
jgi:hypothetical protein